MSICPAPIWEDGKRRQDRRIPGSLWISEPGVRYGKTAETLSNEVEGKPAPKDKVVL